MSITVTEPGTTGAPDLNATMAGEIRAWMGRRGVRQSQLARALGENEQWVSVRLRGITPINVPDLARIARVLGINVVDLLPNEEREVTLRYPLEDRPLLRSPLARSYPTGARPPGRLTDNRPPRGSRRTSPVAA